MFKLNESVFDEVTEQLEKNLNKFASDNATIKDKKLVEALELLNISAESLENFGFEKEANIITKLIVVAAKKKKSIKKDPHTSGLTSEKMISNLKNKGTVFNADDTNMAHDHKLPSQEMGYPIIYLTEKDQVLCSECANEIHKEGGKVTGHLYQEGPTRECEICSVEIESSNGDPDENYGKLEDNNEAKDHKLKYFPESLHGIPVIYLEKGDQDYNTYCSDCAKKLQDQGKNIHGHLYEEGPNRECQMCNKELESAMGQEQYYKENADPEDNLDVVNKSHEGPDEYKREKLENGADEYDEMIDELDEHDAEDQVFI